MDFSEEDFQVDFSAQEKHLRQRSYSRLHEDVTISSNALKFKSVPSFSDTYYRREYKSKNQNNNPTDVKEEQAKPVMRRSRHFSNSSDEDSNDDVKEEEGSSTRRTTPCPWQEQQEQQQPSSSEKEVPKHKRRVMSQNAAFLSELITPVVPGMDKKLGDCSTFMEAKQNEDSLRSPMAAAARPLPISSSTTGHQAKAEAEKSSPNLNHSWSQQRSLDPSMKLPLGVVSRVLPREWNLVRMYIERRRPPSRFSSLRRFTSRPVYELHLGDFLHLRGQVALYARNVRSTSGVHYVLSSQERDCFLPRARRSVGYVGKLRGNRNSNEYCLYDQGLGEQEHSRAAVAGQARTRHDVEELEDEEDVDLDMEDEDEEDRLPIQVSTKIRNCLGAIVYPSACSNETKYGIEIGLPQVSPENSNDGRLLSWPDRSTLRVEEDQDDVPQDLEPLLPVFKRIQTAGTQNISLAKRLRCFQGTDAAMLKHTTADELKDDIEAFAKYHHPSTKSSVKNFQLFHTRPASSSASRRASFRRCDRRDEVVLQMSKVSSDIFSVDVRHPLTMAQAFAICLTRFDAT